MGLFIHLNVNPQHIEPQQWETTYDDSLLLLKKFPLPLMSFTSEELLGQKRLVYTSNIVRDKNTADEHWRICGDMVSYRHAESFRLYRDLHESTKSGGVWCDDDVLWAPKEMLDYVDGNGTDVFGNKTQGYPYHLALLAVAILFESRFPDSIFSCGHIDSYQVANMMEWVNMTLNTVVIEPVCLDGKRLYQRLDVLYDDPALAIERFKTLFCGSDEAQLELLLAHAPRPAVSADLIQELGRYRTLNQFGAIALLSQFLTVTQDLEQLIELVVAAGQAEQKFDLESLLRVLCQHFVTIDFQEREPLLLFAQAREELMTIEDTFTHLFVKMGGAPSSIEFYVETTELLNTFSAHDREKTSRFRQIIVEGEQTCREALRQVKELLDQMAEADPAQRAEEQPAADPPADAKALRRRPIQPEELYIVDQARRQRQQFENPKAAAQQMGAQLETIIRDHPHLFSATERSYYLENIYRASYQNGFALRETGWRQIDEEQNIDILKCILALSLVSEREISFWHWRIHVLEHRSLWPYLVAAKVVGAAKEGERVKALDVAREMLADGLDHAAITKYTGLSPAEIAALAES